MYNPPQLTPPNLAPYGQPQANHYNGTFGMHNIPQQPTQGMKISNMAFVQQNQKQFNNTGMTVQNATKQRQNGNQKPNKTNNQNLTLKPVNGPNRMSPFGMNPYYNNTANAIPPWNGFTNGFNLGDSFIPGLQKQNLGSKKLIWDNQPNMQNFYGMNNKNNLQIKPKPTNPGMNKKPKKSFMPLADSVFLDPDQINDLLPNQSDTNRPKIKQQKCKLALSNILNFFMKPKQKEKPLLPTVEEYPQVPMPNKMQVSPGSKNWVIQSFIPKPPVNENHQNNNLNRSISFIADSKHYRLIDAEYLRKGKNYVDQKFPPQFHSIWGFGETNSYDKRNLQKLVWERPKAIFRNGYKVFQDHVEPSDIVQGMLGDCYFLSAISAIAENENRIKRIFLQRQVTKSGAYCVALCLNGMWEEVVVDDYFPCHKVNKTPAFNSSKKNEIWVMLLEKAWAKVHGGYINIDGGLTREALHDLTGAPATTYFNDELTFDEHWQYILEGEKKNFIMTAGSNDICGNGTDNKDPKTGLCGNHAYSLISAYELKRSSNGEYRVLKPGEKSSSKNERVVELRNPWGKGEWKGKWSDNDTKHWTSRLKKSLNHSLLEDGKFFMPFKEFMKYFHDYQVCYYHDDYLYSSQRYSSTTNKPTYLEFKVTKSGEYYFSVNQINKRFFRKADRKYQLNKFPNLPFYRL